MCLIVAEEFVTSVRISGHFSSNHIFLSVEDFSSFKKIRENRYGYTRFFVSNSMLKIFFND